MASRKVGVKTADGQVLEFDEVVITTPLGWLKQNPQAFHPALPDRLSRAIQSIGYGSLEKVGPRIGRCGTRELTLAGLHLLP